MKIVSFKCGSDVFHGSLDDDSIRVLSDSPFKCVEFTGDSVSLGEVQLQSPVQPPNVLAIGLNYRRHAKESGMAMPDHPLLFIKANSSVIGPDAPIVLPRVAPDEVDYEAELCIVIGKTARNVSEDKALDYVFGYTCGNDVSARDCQLKLDGQWARGKSFDTFCPLGPWIETEVEDPDNLAICLRINDQIMQKSSTSDLIFNCSQLISFLSSCMTLLPGTVIMTGTPEGVGFARDPQVFLKSGDRVEVEIEGIGALSNSVVAG